MNPGDGGDVDPGGGNSAPRKVTDGGELGTDDVEGVFRSLIRAGLGGPVIPPTNQAPAAGAMAGPRPDDDPPDPADHGGATPSPSDDDTPADGVGIPIAAWSSVVSRSATGANPAAERTRVRSDAELHQELETLVWSPSAADFAADSDSIGGAGSGPGGPRGGPAGGFGSPRHGVRRPEPTVLGRTLALRERLGPRALIGASVLVVVASVGAAIALSGGAGGQNRTATDVLASPGKPSASSVPGPSVGPPLPGSVASDPGSSLAPSPASSDAPAGAGTPGSTANGVQPVSARKLAASSPARAIPPTSQTAGTTSPPPGTTVPPPPATTVPPPATTTPPSDTTLAPPPGSSTTAVTRPTITYTIPTFPTRTTPTTRPRP